jgi:opacity protein-like surface antigen
MHLNLKNLTSARVWRYLAVAVLAVTYSALNAQYNAAGGSVPQDVFRAGAREFYATYKWFTAPELTVNDITIPINGINVTHDSVMQIKDTDVYGIGFGFGINEKLNINGEIGFGSPQYRMTWGPYEIKGTGSLFTSRLNLDYNILSTQFTPVITAGVGYQYFDSGVPSDDPEYVCWWDPWWGYVCDGYIDTHTASEFTYNLGAGFRWDVTDGFFIKALYDVTWMSVGASGTEAFPEYQVQLGWKW